MKHRQVGHVYFYSALLYALGVLLLLTQVLERHDDCASNGVKQCPSQPFTRKGGHEHAYQRLTFPLPRFTDLEILPVPSQRAFWALHWRQQISLRSALRVLNEVPRVSKEPHGKYGCLLLVDMRNSPV